MGDIDPTLVNHFFITAAVDIAARDDDFLLCLSCIAAI